MLNNWMTRVNISKWYMQKGKQVHMTEKKYAPIELEVAALVFAVESFKVYLLRNSFTLYTDHPALTSPFLTYRTAQM